MIHDYSLHTIADLESGEHLCFLDETEEEHRTLFTSFLRQGLERDEKVLYIVDIHPVETILGYLQDDGLDVEAYLAGAPPSIREENRDEQLSILTVDDTYMRGGVFDPDEMIALLRSETEHAVAEGYSTLRLTGEMTWALREPSISERLIEYESKLNEFLSGSKCIALCQYDRRRFADAMLLDVLHTHPIVVVGTEIYDNLYYMPPRDLLGYDVHTATLNYWLENLIAFQGSVTELKRMKEMLVNERNLLNTLMDSVPDRIYFKDMASRFTKINKAQAQMLGVSDPKEAIGKTDFDFFPLALATRHYTDEQRLFQSEQPLVGLEEVLIDRAGNKRWFSTTKMLLRNSHGKIMGLVGVSREITEQKIAE